MQMEKERILKALGVINEQRNEAHH